MARKRKAGRKRGKRTPAAGGKVRVKGHTRSPRGPSRDKKGRRKPTVYVRGYRRKVG